MTDLDVSEMKPVSNDLHREVERFLYREARLLDRELLREWLDTVVDPDIRYQMVVREERFKKDKAPLEDTELLVFDDNHTALNMRVRQFESGLQTMMDPRQRMRRAVTNIEAFYGENEGEYLVLSYGLTSRFRRLYEHEQVVFSREDVLKKGQDDTLRLLSRRIELSERVVRNKNLMFFL